MPTISCVFSDVGALLDTVWVATKGEPFFTRDLTGTDSATTGEAIFVREFLKDFCCRFYCRMIIGTVNCQAKGAAATEAGGRDDLLQDANICVDVFNALIASALSGPYVCSACDVHIFALTHGPHKLTSQKK